MTGGGSVQPEDLDPRRLAAIFDAPAPLTIGLEEEVMLLDPQTLDLAPVAPEVLARLDGDPRFKPELPASQVEIVTEPAASAAEALAQLAAGRRDLAAAATGLARPAVAGVHPFAAASGELNEAPRYARLATEYGPVARRQLVTSLQVHVAVGDAGRTLAVYNRLRERLPELAALAANAAFHEGRDSGLASVRPTIAATLPRQGVPPVLASWDQFAAELRWGARAGGVADPRMWWWELRPNPAFGTLEVRVPDAQTTLADAGAIAAFVQAMVASLAQRDEGPSSPAQDWRIEENRWSAGRYGVGGGMADLETGDVVPTRARLACLLDEFDPLGAELGSASLLAHARRLVEANGAMRQRRLVEERGVRGMTAWLADHFLDRDPDPDAVLGAADRG